MAIMTTSVIILREISFLDFYNIHGKDDVTVAVVPTTILLSQFRGFIKSSSLPASEPEHFSV